MNGRPRIVLEHVNKTFPTEAGTLLAVEDVSLTVKDGEFISLIGPSGCGKTTILNMIAGFHQPSAGRIALDDVPITGRVLGSPNHARECHHYATNPSVLARNPGLAGGLRRQ